MLQVPLCVIISLAFSLVFFARRYNSAKVKPLKTNGRVIEFKSTC